MQIAVCIEKSGGMLLGGRRLSQDRTLREKLTQLLCEDGVLLMNSYSAKQFNAKEKIVVSEDFLNQATEKDICFLESTTVPIENVTKLFLFQWNRSYPADVYFKFNAKEMGFKKASAEDFQGSSHKKITLTVYERK